MGGNCKVLTYAGVVSLLALVLSVPKFFEYEIEDDEDFQPGGISLNEGYQASKFIVQLLNNSLILQNIKDLSNLFELITSY